MAAERLRSLCYLSTICAQLNDSILVANKVVEDYKIRNSDLVFKLDVDKAYSR